MSINSNSTVVAIQCVSELLLAEAQERPVSVRIFTAYRTRSYSNFDQYVQNKEQPGAKSSGTQVSAQDHLTQTSKHS